MKMTKHVLLPSLIVALIFLSATAMSVESVKPADVFAQANIAYEKEDYATAQNLYAALISQGFGSAELYYNMGNVYFRKGERGRAVLFYERAADLAPRDADVQFNLSLARSHIKDSDGVLLRSIVLYFTANEIGALLLIVSAFFFCTGGAVLIGWITGGPGWRLSLWIGGASLVVLACWFGVNVSMRSQPRAVIVAPPGEVRNGPGLDYAVGFTIPEGSGVLILSKRPDWVQIGVPQQGLKGWIPSSEVELITSAS